MLLEMYRTTAVASVLPVTEDSIMIRIVVYSFRYTSYHRDIGPDFHHSFLINFLCLHVAHGFCCSLYHENQEVQSRCHLGSGIDTLSPNYY